MELLQHIFVTVVAAGAAGAVVWRVISAGKPGDAPAPSCGSCPTAKTIESRTGAARRG